MAQEQSQSAEENNGVEEQDRCDGCGELARPLFPIPVGDGEISKLCNTCRTVHLGE